MERSKLTRKQIEQCRELGIYIHIPFCVKKCDYCDFLSAPATAETMSKYCDALLAELDSYLGRVDGYQVPTIFFGGGTPSCAPAENIQKIMEELRRIFRLNERLEATIEVNPGTLDREKLQLYKSAGINRLSFGLQSADNGELKLLGRIHTYEQFKENYLLARSLGFHNINIDLMSAIPGQTLVSWEDTLNKVLQLSPEHISAYSLILEEGTKFFERYGEGTERHKELVEEETDRLIYHKTKEILKAHGYERYEFSNYSKPGYECSHNSSYWIGTQYLGIGLGASSLYQDCRFSNLRDIEEYIKAGEAYKNATLDNHQNCFRNNSNESDKGPKTIGGPFIEANTLEHLTSKQRMEEFMFLGLRMCRGIRIKDFNERFHTDMDLIYGEVLEQLIKQALIVRDSDNIRLTDYGIDISNYVLSKFLL